MIELHEGDFPPYFGRYINRVSGMPLLEALDTTKTELLEIFEDIDEEKSNYAYEEGKWTIKEMLSHMIDTERVMSYRALRLARNDKTPLPGFEQDDFVDHANANARTLEELLNEYEVVRNATKVLFETFDNEVLQRKGTVSDGPMIVAALGYIIAGHERHHVGVLKERYLQVA